MNFSNLFNLLELEFILEVSLLGSTILLNPCEVSILAKYTKSTSGGTIFFLFVWFSNGLFFLDLLDASLVNLWILHTGPFKEMGRHQWVILSSKWK